MHLLFYGKEPGQSSGNTAKLRAEKYTEKACIETEESVCGKYFSKSATIRKNIKLMPENGICKCIFKQIIMLSRYASSSRHKPLQHRPNHDGNGLYQVFPEYPYPRNGMYQVKSHQQEESDPYICRTQS